MTGTFGYHTLWPLFAQPARIRPAIRQTFLVLGRETRAPPDLVYGSPKEENDDRFVEQMRESLVTAYTEVRQHMQRSAKKNKRYYDLGLGPKKFEVGHWVLNINPRKLKGNR